jgi:putative tryptophan/tyrosine transport system substrate-binding protein
MRRRELLVGAVIALWPMRVTAQQPGSVYRIGWLRNGRPPESFVQAFREGLRQLGYVEGQNIIIEYGLAESAERLPEAAAELIRRKVDVIIASGTPPVPAARSATKTIPIVFVASIDPITTGTVASLAHPGGNITGFTLMSADLMGKRLQLLKEVIPHLSRVAILSQAVNPGNVEYLRQAEIDALALGLELQPIAVHNAADFNEAFAQMRDAGALVQLEDVLFTSHRKQLVELATRNRLPAIYGFREFADVGGLMVYGPDLSDQYRQAAAYIDMILKGVKPGDLPVQQPTKFELVINLKTARAIGLNIPQPILARADQLIE